MKLTAIFTIFMGLLCLSTNIKAEEIQPNLEILAERGKGVVTQKSFTARATKIPEKLRKETLRDRKRVGDLLQALLITSQLAADAREAGFDKEEFVIERMRLAADKELADAWLTRYVEERSTADYEALAHEYYLLNKPSIMSSPKVDVSHILISTKERSDAEAEALAASVSSQLIENPSKFDEFVVEYSDDPSAATNTGKFRNVRKGAMVKPFEVTAFALQPGEISVPVKTEYGYHIIRQDAYIKPEQMKFEDVKGRLIMIEREKHNERVRIAYLDSLNSQKIVMTEAQIQEMVRRQFGEDYVDPETTTRGKSE